MRILLLLIVVGAMTWCHAGEEAREVKRRFKGVELYCWREKSSQAWRFSLLSGSNRLKTPAEITAPAQVLEDIAHLKVALSHLAIGENVNWADIDRKHPSSPPPEVVAEVQRAAAALQLKLGPPPP